MTLHEDAARKLVDSWGSQPGGAETLLTYHRKIQEPGWYNPAYRDAIGQHHYRDWPLHQTAAFAWVHAAIGFGEAAQIDIGLGHEPHQDHAREENAAALRDLPAPFVAEVNMRQYGGDEDGILRWTEPVTADLVIGRGDNGEYVMGTVEVPAGFVPLEIGTTYASRTAMHLAQDGGVARWAYGHDALRVFVWVGERIMIDMPFGLTLPRPEDLAPKETTDG